MLPRRVVAPLALLLTLAGVGLADLRVAPPAGAQSQVEFDPEVVHAREQAQKAQLDAHNAANQLTAAQNEQGAVQSKIADTQHQIADLTTQRAALQAQREELLVHVRARARVLYVGAGGNVSGLVDLFTKRPAELLRRQKLGDVAAQTDQKAINQLVAADEQLGGVQKNLRQEQASLEAQKSRLDGVLADLASRQRDLDQKVAVANQLLAKARELGAYRVQGELITGRAGLTAAEIGGWFRTRGYRPQLSGITIEQLAQIFIDEGNAENVRGDVAFAQSVIETGGFSSAPANNYSGIGWCDSCATGNTFPTPRDGVRGQIQLLLNYADPYSRAAKLHNPVSPHIWGSDPTVAARRYDTFFAKGWAPTWTDMGNGNWATDPGYSKKVLGIWNSMKSYALSG